MQRILISPQREEKTAFWSTAAQWILTVYAFFRRSCFFSSKISFRTLFWPIPASPTEVWLLRGRGSHDCTYVPSATCREGLPFSKSAARGVLCMKEGRGGTHVLLLPSSHMQSYASASNENTQMAAEIAIHTSISSST